MSLNNLIIKYDYDQPEYAPKKARKADYDFYITMIIIAVIAVAATMFALA